MVPKKKTKHAEEEYNSLYIPMHDYKEKRKVLLSSLKDSLVMQEEYEKIVEIRKRKAELLRQIKKNMDHLNTDYQHIKKILPNVKNVLPFTQKEITELDSHIALLKEGINADEERVSDYEFMEEHLSFQKRPTKQEKAPPVVKEEPKKVAPAPVKKKAVEPSKLTKIDRIKNNLSVIESKLNKL